MKGQYFVSFNGKHYELRQVGREDTDKHLAVICRATSRETLTEIALEWNRQQVSKGVKVNV